MNLTSVLVDGTLRVTALQPPGPGFEARVERMDGRRILVTCERPLDIGSAIQLDASDRMLLAEVLSWERAADGFRVLLDIRHSLLHADLEHIRLGLEAPDPRAGAAGA